jgi:hypothetical protein
MYSLYILPGSVTSIHEFKVQFSCYKIWTKIVMVNVLKLTLEQARIRCEQNLVKMRFFPSSRNRKRDVSDVQVYII